MRLAPFVLAAFVAPAFGQVHRCDGTGGPVFQQGPCGGADAVASASPPTPSAGSQGGGRGRSLCADTAALTFGEGTRITVVRRGGTEVVKIRGTREIAITYEMSIDEKTERKAYLGARTYFCFVDTQEARVFRIAAPLQRQPIASSD